MPYIVKGEPGSWRSFDPDYERKDFDYKYPEGLNLRPGSDLHKDLRNKIWERARQARNEIQKRFESWRELDRKLTAYIPLKEEEERVLDKDEDKPVSIVFPYTYSELESVLTYLVAAFLQDPMIMYEGVEDDDTVGAMLMELVVRLHCNKSKVPLNVHTVLRDSLVYGIGAAVPEWTRRYGKKPIVKKSLFSSLIGASYGRSVSMEHGLLYEGNALSNIDPYMLLLDPTISSNEIQKGEFIGWVDRTNYMQLLSEESQADSGYFNVRYLKDKKDRKSTLALDQSAREERHGGSSELNKGMSGITSVIDIIKMYVTLIPKDWKLGGNEYPEKWYFELASDDIIVRCQRADHAHGMYPMAVASPEADGYSITPMGRMEILGGLQHVLDFLFNSHIANVRKAINDMLIVDPFLVNIRDLQTPAPGKLIRLRRPAWGRGVDKVVQQLEVSDITRTNIADSLYITQWMDRVAGADQSLSGVLRTGGPERLTKAEFQDTRGSSMGRMQRMAQLISMQFFQDLGTFFAVHTQQYMDKEVFVKIVGRNAERLSKMFGGKENIEVTPDKLAISYDLLMRDGSVPGMRFSDAWLEMFKIIAPDQQLRNEFDIVKIFSFIATQLGAKNVEEFKRNTDRIQPQVLPDEIVEREAQKGNLVPIGA